MASKDKIFLDTDVMAEIPVLSPEEFLAEHESAAE
jgi:hypothetical protein